VSDTIIIFVFILAFIAVFLRADFAVTLVYLFLGVFIAGRWWSRKALSSVNATRTLSKRAFQGERVLVRLEIRNTGFLPAVWLQIHDSLPAQLTVTGLFSQVISLGPGRKMNFEYMLEGRKRGYYQVGPLTFHSGDIFGFSGEQQRSLPADYLTVFPKIVPLTRVSVPSHSPLGSLRHSQPIFEDPARVKGKRNYVAGDSLRKVDWKSTAATGRLQVKMFDASVALETAIFLNLNSTEYNFRSRLDYAELAITVAASLANWITGLRQAVGLATNGLDPLQEEGLSRVLLARRGRGHLIRILDILARVQMGETVPLIQLLRKEKIHLSWGTSLILITPQIDDALFDELFQARRAGLNAVLIPCGPVAGFSEVRRQAAAFGFPLYPVLNERDLDMWRK
jgi:uncharacterized protein (DUF58 family)